MSKRRNPKKEKAERNRVYARQFRKQSSRYSSQNKRFGRSNFSRDDEKSTQEKEDQQ